MARSFQDYINRSFPNIPDDYVANFEQAERTRKVLVWKLQRDLHDAAINLGQTETQAIEKIDALFSTFSGEWSIYILTGSPAIITAIQNDATLTWLDVQVAGTSIRQRLINRLS